MALMVGCGYIIYGWLVPSVQLYDFVSIVCLIPFAHAHTRSSITFVCTCIFPCVLCVLHALSLRVTRNTHLTFGWCVPYTCLKAPVSLSGGSRRKMPLNKNLSYYSCLDIVKLCACIIRTFHHCELCTKDMHNL